MQHLVNYGVNLWDYHPIQAASASVWIQVGIGLWMILAVRGWSARLAGLAGVAWGLVVWAFGEAFGGIFAPGLTVLFGAPGAALIYVVAGALLALPERAWANARRLGRLLLGGTGVFFLGMALLQAWPGRGFWQGKAGGQLGSLTAMIASMAGTPQPHALHAIVSGFGNFAISHGFAVNLIAVIALAALGAGLLTAAVRADARLARIVVIAGAVFCLADWVLVEDFGFFGGLGTDPNSMIPFILLFTAGYLGLAPAPEPALVQPDGYRAGRRARGWARTSRQPAGAPQQAGRVPALLRAFAGAPMRFVAGVGALAVILVGAAPMAFATANPNADPITAQAIAGTNGQLDTPAANFTLTSQDGRQVSLASLRGKVVLLTFLDPVCTTDCPLIAQEMRSADAMLGAKASNTELVAVVANPTYISTRVHPGVHQPGEPEPGAQLAVPHRVAEPAQGRLARVRDRGREPACRRDGRAQRHRLRDQRQGPGAAGDQRRPRPGDVRHEVLVRRPPRQLRHPDDGPIVSRVTTAETRPRTHGRRRGREPRLRPPGCGHRRMRFPGVLVVGFRRRRSPASNSMATSIATAADSWAVVPMASDPAFWQVFARAGNVGDVAARHPARGRDQRGDCRLGRRGEFAYRRRAA